MRRRKKSSLSHYQQDLRMPSSLKDVNSLNQSQISDLGEHQIDDQDSRDGNQDDNDKNNYSNLGCSYELPKGFKYKQKRT